MLPAGETISAHGWRSGIFRNLKVMQQVEALEEFLDNWAKEHGSDVRDGSRNEWLEGIRATRKAEFG